MGKPTLTYPLLCLITDPTVPDLVTRVEVALSAGVNMLQLRAHALPAAELYRLALTLRPLCQRYETIFLINDRIDVGLVTGADGFQLGRHSLPLAVARQLIGEDYLLGASVHSREEALAAERNGADFLLVGTIFASHTHPNEPPCGTDLLHAIRWKSVGARARPRPCGPVGWSPKEEVVDGLSGWGQARAPTESATSSSNYLPLKGNRNTCPLLAVGGITQTNARQVMQAGADGIAVISAILGSDNVTQAVSELRMAINL